MKKGGFFVAVALLMFATRVCGQDFSVQLSYGNTLYFSITDADRQEVMVVAPNPSATDVYAGYTRPSGALVIPSDVHHEGQVYTVTAIGESAFSGCADLRMVMFPSSIKRIEAYAFNGCSGLNERVTIGKKVKMVGNSAFYGCYNLPEVCFQAEACDSMGGSMSATVFGNCRNLHRVIIDEGVSRIPDYAFCGVDAIKSVSTLPLSLRHVGRYAFAYCSSLAGSIDIPDGVTEIGECAFHQCHSLKSVSLGASVKEIGDRAFYHCIKLTKIEIKAYAPPVMGPSTFAELSGLVTFVVPCVSKGRYLRNEQWQAMAPFGAFGPCHFAVKATMANQAAGVIVGNGEYTFGDTVDLMAVCAAGYGFEKWSDGSTENPRRIIVDDNVSLTAQTRSSLTLVVHDTVYRIDTVFSNGYRVIHDTVDFLGKAVSINDCKELSFDSVKKRLKWDFPREEKVVSVSLFNQIGECVYTGDGRRGSYNMSRLASGVYIVRVETHRRVLCCRIFMYNK